MPALLVLLSFSVSTPGKLFKQPIITQKIMSCQDKSANFNFYLRRQQVAHMVPTASFLRESQFLTHFALNSPALYYLQLWPHYGFQNMTPTARAHKYAGRRKPCDLLLLPGTQTLFKKLGTIIRPIRLFATWDGQRSQFFVGTHVVWIKNAHL